MNRQVRLKSRPSGISQAEHFKIVEAPVPDPSDCQVLVRNIYPSVDPGCRWGQRGCQVIRACSARGCDALGSSRARRKTQSAHFTR